MNKILITVMLLVYGMLLPVVFADTRVEVRLFDTKPVSPIQQIILSGHIRIQQHPTPLLSQYRVSLNNNKLQLESISQRVLGQYAQLTISALDSKGVCIERSIKLEKRCYAGEIKIYPIRHSLRILNTVSKRDYVASVLASETPPNWPLEALKAQSVLTQTRLQHHPIKKNISGVPTISVGDSTNDEAYFGIRNNHAVSVALSQTWGDVLTYQNRPIEVFYHSTCAGHTSDDGYFSGHQHEYSVGVRCPYCTQSPFYKDHVATIPLTQWQTRFPKPIVLSSPDDAGRFRVATDSRQQLSAYQIWLRLGQQLGWDKAPGTRFSMTPNKNQITIKSRGAGHGVGLCQLGAAGMAKQGFTYREILHFYYPRAAVRHVREL